MAFFDLPKDEDIPSAARHWLDELKRLRGITTIPQSRLAYVSTPGILEAQVTAETNLFNQRSGRSRFSWEARMFAFMLVSHARRCTGCFGASRQGLIALGFDDRPRRHLCQSGRPAASRARTGLRAVRAALRTQRDGRRAQALPRDGGQSLTPDDVREMIGSAAFCMFNTIFTTLANTAVRDE